MCQRRSGRVGRTMPALVRVRRVSALVFAVVARRWGSDMARIFSSRRESERRWAVTALDERPDVARATGVEEDVTLADGGLLLEQPRVEQRLPHLLRERAVVAGETARQVREVRVVAAPLAHPVEPLEDPAGDAARRVGVLVRAHDLALG